MILNLIGISWTENFFDAKPFSSVISISAEELPIKKDPAVMKYTEDHPVDLQILGIDAMGISVLRARDILDSQTHLVQLMPLPLRPISFLW